MRTRAVYLLGTALFVASCKRTPEPVPAPVAPPIETNATPAPQPNQRSRPDASLPPAEVSWIDPPGWKRAEQKSAMRKASYVVPRAAGDAEDGDLGVFYFGPGQGGGIEANVDRWVKQFKDTKPGDVKRSDRQANGMRQHIVEIESGTFDGSTMMAAPSPPKPNYGLLGAIVEAPSGAYFFKFTGPKATVLGAKAAFFVLLDSVKAPGG